MYGADAAPEISAGGETIGKGRGQQSVTFTDVKSPSPHYERKIPKKAREKASLKKDRANPFVETKATAERGIPRRPPVKGASAPLKALTPFILGGGALQMLPNEAFGERAASNMERANRRGGGGKKPFHLRKRDIPLTKLSAKKYRRYA